MPPRLPSDTSRPMPPDPSDDVSSRRPASRSRTQAALFAAGDILPDTARIGHGAHLELGGCDLVELAGEHGTPLYVIDLATILARIRAFQAALADSYPGRARVAYAAKAYGAPWLFRVLADAGVDLDVVSGGELHAAALAGFPCGRIHVHGNDKRRDELELALGEGVGRVVIDNLDEVGRLARLADANGMRQPVWLRVAPGVAPITHPHLITGGADTKFGLPIAGGAAEAGVRAVLDAPALELRGLHAHIGSLIDDVEPYRRTVERLFAFAAAMRDAVGFQLHELSPGGGFGVRYTLDDPPVSPVALAGRVAAGVAELAPRHGFELPELTIEPGRSIIAQAAVALYTVGSVKAVPGGRRYVAIDGGMADNIRPTAYGARYSALLANRVTDADEGEYAIAGRYCETGDVLIQAARLPRPAVDDLVAVPVSGAYQLAMASNYNLSPRPAVVVVAGGRARIVHRRETYDDLLACEVADADLA
jgi:diaminopimelate decarboxylase